MNKDDLDAICADIWHRLVRGKADRHSPFHTPIVASVDRTGAPQQRVMVLRKVDQNAGTLRFHTDTRTPKIMQLADNAAVSVIGYDAGAKIQIRVTGTAHASVSGVEADTAWEASAPSSRRCYLAEAAPGTHSAVPISGLPTHVESRVPSVAETAPGRKNFAILSVEIERLEWLYLASDGHRRAAFTRDGTGWSGQWLVP
jgi:pyridoxamine 5'-phosphate oxidase